MRRCGDQIDFFESDSALLSVVKVETAADSVFLSAPGKTEGRVYLQVHASKQVETHELELAAGEVNRKFSFKKLLGGGRKSVYLVFRRIRPQGAGAQAGDSVYFSDAEVEPDFSAQSSSAATIAAVVTVSAVAFLAAASVALYCLCCRKRHAPGKKPRRKNKSRRISFSRKIIISEKASFKELSKSDERRREQFATQPTSDQSAAQDEEPLPTGGKADGKEILSESDSSVSDLEQSESGKKKPEIFTRRMSLKQSRHKKSK